MMAQYVLCSHYLNNICYLHDNHSLNIAAIVMRDILNKCIGGFNISSHTSQYMIPVSFLSLLPMMNA